MNTQTDGGDAREIHIFRRCSKQLRVDGEADMQRKQVQILPGLLHCDTSGVRCDSRKFFDMEVTCDKVP